MKDGEKKGVSQRGEEPHNGGNDAELQHTPPKRPHDFNMAACAAGEAEVSNPAPLTPTCENEVEETNEESMGEGDAGTENDDTLVPEEGGTTAEPEAGGEHAGAAKSSEKEEKMEKFGENKEIFVKI